MTGLELWLKTLVESGAIYQIAALALVLETIALFTIYRAASLRALVIANALSGGMLIAALLAVFAKAPAPLIAACLLLSLTAHAFDVWLRHRFIAQAKAKFSEQLPTGSSAKRDNSVPLRL